MAKHLSPTSTGTEPRLVFRVQEQLRRASADTFERSSELPLLRLAIAVLVTLVMLGTAGGLLAAH